MTNYRIPLAFNNFQDAELNAVNAVMKSGRLTQGQMVQEFEREFAAFHGSKYAVMVNSGSSAALIAIEAIIYCGILRGNTTHGQFHPGDEVITPGLSWPTTLKPVLNHGLRPVFCDVDLKTLNASVATVDAVRSKKTRMVIGVPVMGNPTGLDELREYCAQNKLILVEDACESLGAETSAGRKVGRIGLASAFSFYFSHHISTVEGGAIVTDDDDIADLCFALRSHGWTRHFKLDRFDYSRDANSVDPRFCFVLPGYNVRATEIAAAIGRVQLHRLPDILKMRRKMVKHRSDAIAPERRRVLFPGIDIADRHSWMTLPLLLPSKQVKDRAQALLEESGIETRPIIVGNILRHPIVKHLDMASHQPALPNCDAVFERGLMIGLNPYATEAEEAYVSSILKRITEL